MQVALPTRERVERALAEVYARPEFAPPARSPIREWLRSAWQTVREWFAALLPDVQVGAGSARVLYYGLLAVLALIALWTAVHLVRRLRAMYRLRERERTTSAAGGESAPDAAVWDARAAAAAARGAWREAALALYPALLLRLQQAGALQVNAHKTPGDYRREVRSRPDAARALGRFLHLWEPAVFGGRALDADGYERLRTAAGGGAGA